MMRPSRADFLWAMVATILLEGVACLLRFGLGMESTRDTGALGPFTFGLRIHHGYVGLLALIASLVLPSSRPWRRLLFRAGAALLASDLLHHFVVLWALTGSPQFDFFYPGHPRPDGAGRTLPAGSRPPSMRPPHQSKAPA
jgi:hypothetical protein